MMDEQVFTSLRLQNFRSYLDFAVELTPEVNIVVGPNASGKTNLLEALLVICGSSSYRASVKDLIKDGQHWSRIDSNLTSSNRSIKISLNGELIDKTYLLNEKPKKRLSFSEKLPTVLFEPENMRLLNGSPDLRRDFFDKYLEETEAEFSLLKNKYKRVLAQRNHLLKSTPSTIQSQIFTWNVRLSELAGKLVGYRFNLAEKLNTNLANIYSEIAQTKLDIKLEYSTNLPASSYESALLKALEKSLNTDILRGYTYYGPHREDFMVKINNRLADCVASRGETRTIVLSFKLLEIDLLKESCQQQPLVLLDDVFSELDGSRRRALTQYLKGCQTIITTTDADVIQKNFAQHTNRISLS